MIKIENPNFKINKKKDWFDSSTILSIVDSSIPGFPPLRELFYYFFIADRSRIYLSFYIVGSTENLDKTKHQIISEKTRFFLHMF